MSFLFQFESSLALLTKQGPGCVSGTRARADRGFSLFSLLQFNARTSTKLHVLLQKWRQIARTSLPRHRACHQLTSTSKTIKTVLAAVCELGGGAGWPKGMWRLLFFFCDKMIGYLKARLPLECCVCFGGLLYHAKWFLCLLAVLNWDLASCQWHRLNLSNSNTAACITNVLVKPVCAFVVWDLN